jgi:hypothetical protein
LTLRVFQKMGSGMRRGHSATADRLRRVYFRLRTAPGELDPNLVSGFLRIRVPPPIIIVKSISNSRPGEVQTPVLGQYVIQTYQDPGHLFSFDLSRIKGPAVIFCLDRGQGGLFLLDGLRAAA